MKTMTEKIRLVSDINQEIEKARKDCLLAGGVAFLCRQDGESLTEEEIELERDGDKVEIGVDIERWQEHGRTLTDKGRAELYKEMGAADLILKKVSEQGWKVEENGRGDGLYGAITSYRVR